MGVAGLAAAAALAVQTVAAAPTGPVVALTRVVFNLARGERYEVQQAGLLCLTQRTLRWKGEAVAYEPATYKKAFHTAMAAAGVASEGEVTELFESQLTPADVSVGALVTALHVRACVNHGFAGALTNVRGDAHMAVEWQVFSRSARAVVARIRTDADVTLREPVAGDAAQVTAAALGANAARLAQDEGFRRALAAAGAP